MATVAKTAIVTRNWPELVTRVDLSTIDPGASLDISHGGPTGARVDTVDFEVITLATSQSPVFVSHILASDSLANDTARVVVDTESGGDLTGAIVRVYFHFVEQASGGIT